MTRRITGSRGLRYATIIALVAVLVGGVYVLSSQAKNRKIVGYSLAGSPCGARASAAHTGLFRASSADPFAQYRSTPFIRSVSVKNMFSDIQTNYANL